MLGRSGRACSSASTGWSRASARSAGSSQGATVRLAGVPVGRVGGDPAARVRVERKVQVELLIARRVQDRIRADSVARIETLGLLGDKIIDVTLGRPGCGGAPGRRRAPDRGAVRHGASHPAGGGAPPQPGRALGRAPDDPRAHHREHRRGRRRRDRAGAPEPRRPRSSGARASSTGSSTTGSSGRRSPTRARRSGRSARPCAGSTACSPIPGRPGSPARRGGRSPRRGRPRSG